MNTSLWFGGVIAASVLGMQSLVHGAVLYNVTDLGALGSTGSRATDINEEGVVAGVSTTTQGEHAFLYRDGTMIDLGLPPGSVGNYSLVAIGINDDSLVTGELGLTNPIRRHGFAYRDGMFTDLGTLGGDDSVAYKANNLGEIVGNAQKADGTSHAFIYSNGSMSELGDLDGKPQSVAFDINDAGEVAGASWSIGSNGGRVYSATLYRDGTIVDIGMLLASNQRSQSRAINAHGDVVGTVGSNSFLYANGQVMLLNPNPVFPVIAAEDINDLGQIVGTYAPSITQLAFIYENGVLTDLNTLVDPTLGWELSVAKAINNRGMIVGWGQNSQGQEHAFLLTPVPEPPTILLIVFGIVPTLLRGHSKSKRPPSETAA